MPHVCTCVGMCRGAMGLGPGWVCALTLPQSGDPEPAALFPTFAGDPVQLDGEAREVVSVRCERPDRAYLCLTHGVRLANAYQLELHAERGGTHVIARQCATHGAETWAPEVPR